MADDYLNPIKVEIISAPVLLDEERELANKRFVLGYFSIVYSADSDVTVKLFCTKDETLSYKEEDQFILSKDEKRFSRKIKLIGSIIDFYITITGTFTQFEITEGKISIKTIPVGKHQ